MSSATTEPHIYDGDGDAIMSSHEVGDRIVLLPGTVAEQRDPDSMQRIRIMWGHRLIDDLLANRYHTLVCGVNAVDNSHGFIAQLAERLPTSQWCNDSITAHAKHFVQPHTVSVVKFDMDTVEVLALLRPSEHDSLTLEDLSAGFRIITAMTHRKPQRLPIASVCFLGAKANKLINHSNEEPSFEAVLRTLYESGYRGDTYPAMWMWHAAPTGVYARYPFPDSINKMREGGF